MPEQERAFTPSRSYDIQLKIKDLDYTNDLINISIISSLATAYQVIVITLNLDPNDVILEDIFGSAPMKLYVRLLTQDGIPLEQINFELMYISSDFTTKQKESMSEGKQKDLTPVSITTVCREPFKTMNTMVNKVFIGVTIRDILEELASLAGATLLYDSNGENKEPIEQCCIPPTTLYKIIKEYSEDSDNPYDGYLDKKFGLFDGVPGVFCQRDNKIHVKNLTKKLDKSQTFTIYQLASGTDNNEIIEKSLDGKTFYTYSPISTDWSGNAKFAVIAPVVKYLVSPKDSLSHTITKNLSDVSKNYACSYRNTSIKTDSKISSNSRIRYVIDSGFETNETPFNSRLGRSLVDLSTMTISLDQNLVIMNLMNVGECVKVITQTLEYVDLSGKYILWSSELNFNKVGEWKTTAKINLTRTNKKI